MSQRGADGSRFAVVQRPHGVEHMGDVHNVGLHTFYHLVIRGIGMAGLEDDSLFNAVQGQVAHSLKLGGDRHIDDFSFGGFVNAFHIGEVNRADTFLLLSADALGRQERAFEVYDQDMAVFFISAIPKTIRPFV